MTADDQSQYNLAWSRKGPEPPLQMQVQDGPLRMNGTAFRAVDRHGPTDKPFELLRAEPQGRALALRSEQFDRAHPAEDTGVRERGGRFDVHVRFGGPQAQPTDVLRLSLEAPGTVAGKISVVGSLGDGSGWYEEHAFRLHRPNPLDAAEDGGCETRSFQIVSTEDGLGRAALVDARAWVRSPRQGDREPGLVYRWYPTPAAAALPAAQGLVATLHLHVVTFGAADAPPVRWTIA